MNKQDALKTVVEGARIHADKLTESLADQQMARGFSDARSAYIRKLRGAIAEIADTRYDESGKVSERVRDLDLAESVALLHAVEDHIRSIAGYSRHA